VLALAMPASAEQVWEELRPEVRHRARDRSVHDALEAARPELVRCLEGTPHRRLMVQARVSPRHPLVVRVRPADLGADVRRCAELAVERQLYPLTSRDPVRFAIGRVQVELPTPSPPSHETP
jgi:hypothetical protein